MGMDVDEARGDRKSSGINRARSALSQIPHRDDSAFAYPDITAVGRHPGTVYDRAVPNKEIVLSHGWPSFSLVERFVKRFVSGSRLAVPKTARATIWGLALTADTNAEFLWLPLAPCRQNVKELDAYEDASGPVFAGSHASVTEKVRSAWPTGSSCW